MKAGTAQRISNALLSGAAGFASFLFSLGAFLYITELNDQIIASIVAGAFCLLISYIASERPNSESARALAALGDRDGAFAWLERALRERSNAIAYLRVDPQLDGLRADSRFPALVRDAGLADTPPSR